MLLAAATARGMNGAKGGSLQKMRCVDHFWDIGASFVIVPPVRGGILKQLCFKGVNERNNTSPVSQWVMQVSFADSGGKVASSE